MDKFIIACFGFFLAIPVHAQQNLPVISADSLGANIGFIISHWDNWKFHPGDDTTWSNPEFDDYDWYQISPYGLGTGEIPDSLWDGYGWWRLIFKADSFFYAQNWNLYFYGWGAAEVYLDGELIQRYGNFSTIPELEETYSPLNKLTHPLIISPAATHTIAIRYSYHKVKDFQTIVTKPYEYLGFNLAVINPTYNLQISDTNKSNTLIFSFSSAVLLVLILLHLALYFKFSDDKANLYITILISLLFLSVLSQYSRVIFELNSLWFYITSVSWPQFAALAVLLMPYTVALAFDLEKFYKTVHLLWFFPLVIASNYIGFLQDLYMYFALVLNTVAFILIGIMAIKGYSLKKKSVLYVAAGALGTLSCILVWVFQNFGFLSLPYSYAILNTIFIYTLFPFSLTFYMASRYSYLFGSMEEEVKLRTNELQQSLNELKAAQSQLVQQEKLASLGQLTAGIAHEIKNPLNFVNNFSDLSVELIEETRKELSVISPQPSEALTTLDDIEANLRKIHEHGSRADRIVKSMLQHSRGGSGKMEPTDLNALVKEYVNLAFHGMRAGKNPINVDIEMQLDKNIGEVPLIAEDFSRVILNLCNNAFDAMRALGAERSAHGEHYEPKLNVRTKKAGDSVTIEIEDNGPGIPEEMKDKILQPFFTTKKGTEGTGLGLSITHDIVKAHGGEMKIESKAGVHTRFIVLINKNGGKK